MRFLWTNQTGPKTKAARWGRILAGLGLLLLCLHARSQVDVLTIGGGPRLNSCATWAGFAAGDTYTNAMFNDPYASALDLESNLWVADTGNSDVEQITLIGDRVNSITIHTYVINSVTNKSGRVTDETNYHPFPKVNGVAVDAADNLYILMPTNGLLLQVQPLSQPAVGGVFHGHDNQTDGIVACGGRQFECVHGVHQRNDPALPTGGWHSRGPSIQTAFPAARSCRSPTWSLPSNGARSRWRCARMENWLSATP